MIGSDFTVTVNGYSLGGALSVLFGFYASNDERFTQNGPVKIFSYGMPYAVSHTFADAFRHQEVSRKLQHARFYNSNDIGESLCYICSIFRIQFLLTSLAMPLHYPDKSQLHTCPSMSSQQREGVTLFTLVLMSSYMVLLVVVDILVFIIINASLPLLHIGEQSS